MLYKNIPFLPLLQELRKSMSLYLRRFSAIAGNMINCGPILSWLEVGLNQLSLSSVYSVQIISFKLSLVFFLQICYIFFYNIYSFD